MKDTATNMVITDGIEFTPAVTGATFAPTVQQVGDVVMSVSLKNLADALSKAQGELESVGKGEKGYGYNYASLASTIQESKEALVKNGLSVSQHPGSHEGKPAVTTLLMHKSGEYLRSTVSTDLVEMKSCNTAQRFGATVSYLRRYALQAALNMASEDNDASSEGFKGKANYKKDTKEEKKTAARGRKKAQGNTSGKDKDIGETEAPFRKKRGKATSTDEAF